MIKNFAMVAPEDVRKMFIDLYNEHIPLSDRIYNLLKNQTLYLRNTKALGEITFKIIEQ